MKFFIGLFLFILPLIYVGEAEATIFPPQQQPCIFCYGQRIVGYKPVPYLTPRISYQLNYRYQPIYGPMMNPYGGIGGPGGYGMGPGFGFPNFGGGPGGFPGYGMGIMNPSVQFGPHRRYLGFRSRYSSSSPSSSSGRVSFSGRTTRSPRDRSEREDDIRGDDRERSTNTPPPRTSPGSSQTNIECKVFTKVITSNRGDCRDLNNERDDGSVLFTYLEKEYGLTDKLVDTDSYTCPKGKSGKCAEPIFGGKCRVHFTLTKDGKCINELPQAVADNNTEEPEKDDEPATSASGEGAGEGTPMPRYIERPERPNILASGTTEIGTVDRIEPAQSRDIEVESTDTTTEGDDCTTNCDDEGPTSSNLCVEAGVSCNNKCEGQPKFQGEEASLFPAKWDLSVDEKQQAQCIYHYMKKAPDMKGNAFISCPSGKRSNDEFCLDANYFTQVYLGFQEAANCFLQDPDEKLLFLSLIGHESRFQANAINPGDPSVGLGQTLFGLTDSGKPASPVRDFDKDPHARKIFNDSSSGCHSSGTCGQCKSNFNRYYNDVAPYVDDEKFCASGLVKNPKKGAYLAAATFRNKRKHMNGLLVEGFNCGGEKIKYDIESDNGVADKKLLNQLTAMAYNQGEKTTETILCAYAKIHQGKSQDNIDIQFDRDKIVRPSPKLDQSHFAISNGVIQSLRQGKRPNQKGFWMLQDIYYTNRSDKDYDMNYYYKIIKDAASIEQEKGGLKCSPELPF